MYSNSSFDVSLQQTSRLPIGCLKIEGYLKGATDRWLQVHDSCITPAANAVPIREWPVYSTSEFYKEFKNGELQLKEGLFVGLSTAEGAYTASTDKMDVVVETDQAPLSVTATGDKTTGVNTRQLWAEGVSTKLLYRLIVTELLGDARYIVIYADDAKVMMPALVVPIAANGTVYMSFGQKGQGFQVLGSATANSNGIYALNGTIYTGCTVVVANAVPTYGSAPAVTAASAAILALTN
jgi:hypothetical protein